MTLRNQHTTWCVTGAAFALLLSSCSIVVDDGEVSFVDADAQVLCEEPNSVILAAQAVPTADYVPCVDAMPAGWRLEGTEYRSDGVTIAFASNRAPIADLDVRFESSCEPGDTAVDGGAEALSVPPGALLTSEAVDFNGSPATRLVVTDVGYCAEFFIELQANEAITAEDFPTWQWIPRIVIDAWVLAGTNDRLRLDP